MSRCYRGLADRAVSAYRQGDLDAYTLLVEEIGYRPGSQGSVHRLLVEAGIAGAVAERMSCRINGCDEELKMLYVQLKRHALRQAEQVLARVFADQAYSSDFSTACRLYKMACRLTKNHKLVMDAFTARGLVLVKCRHVRCDPEYPEHAVIVPNQHCRYKPQRQVQLAVA